jgi:hypothetical protein
MATAIGLTIAGSCTVPAEDIYVKSFSIAETEDGSALAPWRSLPPAIAQANGNKQAGERVIVNIWPGVYDLGYEVKLGSAGTNRGLRITRPNITIRMDPAYTSVPNSEASTGRVVINGGIDLNTLRNSDQSGVQTLYPPLYGPAAIYIAPSAENAIIEDIEACYTITGITSEAANTTVTNCHIHHTGQQGIDIAAVGGRTKSCNGKVINNLVHDADQYNYQSQSEDFSLESKGGRSFVRGQKKKTSRTNKSSDLQELVMDWGAGIVIHGRYYNDSCKKFYRGDDGVVRDFDGLCKGGEISGNIVWNVWGENISTYQSSGVVIADNYSFNGLRYDFYLQNADYSILENNLAFFDDSIMDLVRRKPPGRSINQPFVCRNEYAADQAQRDFNDPKLSLLPSTVGAIIRDNVSFGGGDWTALPIGGENCPNVDVPGTANIVTRNTLFATQVNSVCGAEDLYGGCITLSNFSNVWLTDNFLYGLNTVRGKETLDSRLLVISKDARNYRNERNQCVAWDLSALRKNPRGNPYDAIKLLVKNAVKSTSSEGANPSFRVFNPLIHKSPQEKALYAESTLAIKSVVKDLKAGPFKALRAGITGAFPAIIANPAKVSVPEKSKTKVKIALSKPLSAAAVVVNVAYSSGDKSFTVTPEKLTFSSVNWNQPRIIVFSAPPETGNAKAEFTLSAEGYQAAGITITSGGTSEQSDKVMSDAIRQ